MPSNIEYKAMRAFNLNRETIDTATLPQKYLTLSRVKTGNVYSTLRIDKDRCTNGVYLYLYPDGFEGNPNGSWGQCIACLVFTGDIIVTRSLIERMKAIQVDAERLNAINEESLDALKKLKIFY